MKHGVIGIDLGTTYSAVAVWDTDQEQSVILCDAEGHAITPSVVAYDADKNTVTVGHTAQRNLPNKPDDTIIEIKREMGENFRPETLEKVFSSSHYRGDKFTPANPYKVYFANDWRLPQEISAFTLMQMKAIAENSMDCKICDAVITVPAYFKSIQRKATEEAALLAGLYPRQLVPEPTAAAICYGVDRFQTARRRYLVYDLGGGTFDVSVIEVVGDDIRVIATCGDPRLGGGDFDDKITGWVAKELTEKFNLPPNATNKKRIKHKVEQYKIQLSTLLSVDMTFPELRPNDPPTITLTREQFETLIQPLVSRSMLSVTKGLELAKQNKGIEPEDISEVLLVGGSSQIPLVRRKLSSHFERGDDFVRSDLDPAAVVARGAARLALRYAPTSPPFDPRRRVESLTLNVENNDPKPTLIAEHTLGIACDGPKGLFFAPILPQGINLPAEKTQEGFSNGDKKQVRVEVFQGDSTVLYENTLVGAFGIELPAEYEVNSQSFRVAIKMDESGLITCTVVHLETRTPYTATFGHQNSLGGPDKLADKWRELGPLFRASALGEAASAALAATTANVAATAPAATQDMPAEDADFMPPPPAPSAAAASAGLASAVAPALAAKLVEISVEIPAQFQSIVRRAKEEILLQSHPALIKAFNAFAAALNANQPIDQVEELADELENTYQDARLRIS